VKEQRLTMENSKVNQSSGMAAELTETRRTSRSESDDEAVKKRKEVSGSEEVISLHLLFLFPY